MLFQCQDYESRWNGRIKWLKNHGSHYEMKIDSRSGIVVLFGNSSFGSFACMPEFGAGCHLSSLSDDFYNTERLSAVLGPIDGTTVSAALSAISATLKGFN